MTARVITHGGLEATASTPATIKDHNDGTYTIELVPMSSGNFNLHVSLNDGISASLLAAVPFEAERATCDLARGARPLPDGSACECGPGAYRIDPAGDDTGACRYCDAGYYQNATDLTNINFRNKNIVFNKNQFVKNASDLVMIHPEQR